MPPEGAEAGRGSPAGQAGADLDELAEMLKPLSNGVRLKLLRYLAKPHYLEEVASHLSVSRQAAAQHLDKLLMIEAVERQTGRRDSGPVTEYVVNPQAIFLIYTAFEGLATIRRETGEPLRATRPDATGPEGRERALDACLWVVHGPSRGSRIVLNETKRHDWTFGRGARCDVPLEHDPFASNRHARISKGDRGFALTDLHSTNGTFLNESRVPAGSTVPLAQGDLVGVGRTTLIFWDRMSARGDRWRERSA